MSMDILTWKRLDIAAEMAKPVPEFSASCQNIIYAIISKDDTVLYIGLTGVLRKSVRKMSEDPKRIDLWEKCHRIAIHISDESRSHLRGKLVDKYLPIYNEAKCYRKVQPTPPVRWCSRPEGGIYLYQYYRNGECVFVGLTENIRRRLYEHRFLDWHDVDLSIRVKPFHRKGNAILERDRIVRELNPIGNGQEKPMWLLKSMKIDRQKKEFSWAT